MSQFYYFTPCCNGEPFGIVNNSKPLTLWSNFTDTVGEVYGLIIGSYSGCVTYSGTTTKQLTDLPFYNSDPIFLPYDTCENCIENEFSCNPPQPTVTPIITGYKNECGIITIIPMVVECEVSQPSSYTSNDGEVSVSITGGTAPYTTTWSNGNISPAINGLGNGSYTATTVDYWGDFTATTVCTLFTDKDCTFSGETTEITESGLFKYFEFQIISGTSIGLYTIYFDELLSSVNIPEISGTTNLATNLTLTDLSSPNSIIVKVPSDVVTLYLYNEFCNSYITFIPTKTTTYEDFCLTVINGRDISYLHFTPTTIDGNPSWVEETDNSITITYNVNVWVINNYNPGGNTITSNDSVNSNPPSNWMYAGGNSITLLSKNGDCTSTSRSTFSTSINQPTCLCDGSIIFNVNLDNPPFNYSIDNGVTYSSSPIFTNLCSGIYILSVVDLLGNTYSKTVSLDKPVTSTTYTLTLSTTKNTPVSNELSVVNSYETNVVISPPLPDGTTITFDLIHSNTFYSSPSSGTSVLTTGTILNKNSTGITYNTIITGNTQSVNTTPGCQSDIIYQTNSNEIWNSLTLTNTDNITISTTSRVDKTTTGLCVVGYSDDYYSISNAIITGCDCCTLIINT